MNAIEKIKLSSERVKLIAQLKAQELKGREKIVASKRIQEIVTLLKGGSLNATAEEPKTDVDLSPFERIVKNNEITLETLTGAVESTKMLLNSVSTPQVFIDAVEAVSAKVSDGSLMDSLGQAGIDLVNQMLDDIGGAINNKDVVIDLLNTSGWIVSNDGMYSNAKESFSIRINDTRSTTFDVEIYQNQVCVTTLTTNGNFLNEVLDFINEYITVEENKLLLLKNANDRIESIASVQEQIKPIDQISIVDVLAQGASTSRDNAGENPTQEQLENNDYKTAKVVISGIPIAIENPIGSVRRGADADGTPWQTTMTAHYGYVENTMGADGDELDIFIIQDTPMDYDGLIFVISQNDKNGNFDEHKVILGAENKTVALQLYHSHYDENFTGSGAIQEMSIEDFKRRVLNQPLALFDSVQTYMMDSWLDDGHYDLVPTRKLDLSRLNDGEKEPKPTIKEPIVVYLQGAKYYVIHGRKRLDLATKLSEKLIPSILIDAELGYTKDDIKNAYRMCGNIVHAEALGAMIEACASKRAVKELS